jgi:hypothetical protein
MIMQGWRAYALALAVSGLLAGPAAAQQAVDMKLEDAGFKMRPATTPKEVTRLRHLPQHRFVRRTKDGKSYYLYADPIYCKCVFLGGERAMNNYQMMVAPPPSGLPSYNPGAGSNPAMNNMILSMDQDLNDSIIPNDDLLDFHFE